MYALESLSLRVSTKHRIAMVKRELLSIRPKKEKNCYIGVNRPTLKLGPTLQKQKRQKNDRPILKKAKPVILFFQHLILALKMLIWGFETWLVA